ncbi:bifunctional phosphoribosylaminoimidazolecarboxamide formyltransferase/IMP cyclohydrolase [Bremerella sp. P1]|uniref:bifunctional phosphoribosylaminoimidazolecarboxamide formyltransferase/IMP cyclohydrolase n=1 Tax=Bremerella sp. P1 TaxID=3026424 RepID=UPI00236852B4|nr:bifunctional phosphoribosylaminoimidazolecarboxamide formyltransferase/IMP cyclohydrolase [Bremerella sp. P1]WDI44358.1 bifunctional phosphoribosylaminoimidazolecarboxamide formyltransferase/IMP cyclohydrolase [Bremerella sp. P1]
MSLDPVIQNAIISVSNKEGLTEFAQGLVEAGVTIYSTGGTRRHLEEANIPVKDVTEYTQFPEMMDGRLKTLHPKIFGGILCRHDREDDMTAIGEHGIFAIPLVVVNLYPFEETIAKEGVTDAQAIEQIDIGGPTLVRAAAKNHAFSTIACKPSQYPEILAELKNGGKTSLGLRRKLAAAAFAHTAAYDAAIANYFEKDDDCAFPETLRQSFQRKAVLRYGENPHQQGAVYAVPKFNGASLVDAKQLNGKELSYNNLLDLDSALAIARGLPDVAVSVIKHNNPCGAASASTLAEACEKAMLGDPLSAFGSVIGMNAEVDAATAEYLSTPGLFVEAIAAPSFSKEAVEILTTKPKWKSNVRLMEVGPLEGARPEFQSRWIEGGLLVQNTDFSLDDPSTWQVVTETQVEESMKQELLFAWEICRFVKSNAIVLCKDRSLVGAGAGQMSRVDSVQISIEKAADRAPGSVLASDAFFPFPDSIHEAAKAGVKAFIQPGGSKRDQEVIDACNEHKLPMIFTGVRHFRH